MKTPLGIQSHVHSSGRPSAFTRLELAAVLAGLGLLALVVLPALASNRERSARVLCVNNLRLIGQAYAQWGAEHDGRTPVGIPWWQGGLRAGSNPPPGVILPAFYTAGFQNNTWFHFAWISNELRSPKLLVCPSDVEKIAASGWGLNFDGGFVHANYRDRAASYLISLDILPESPLSLLSGDRNLTYNSISGSCSSGIAPCLSLHISPPGPFGIDARLHNRGGNFLLTDGRVEELSNHSFSSRLLEIYTVQGVGAVHYIVP